MDVLYNYVPYAGLPKGVHLSQVCVVDLRLVPGQVVDRGGVPRANKLH